MKKSIYLLFLAIIQLLNAQTYLWPTNSSEKLSATFGEYRSGHFHAGIDIKTNNSNGYPCYAIENGYISRITLKPNGYGKAIYLNLKDGNIAVYGHLDGFPAKIDSIIKKEQKANNKYSLNKYFQKSELPVKKGDVIAYTGDTGTRHPHLHFELRDCNHNPIDPLNFDGLKIEDNTPPVINKIAIVPVTATSLINNLPEYFIAKPALISQGKYRISKPIRFRDDFAIEISTHDIVKGLWNKYGPAKINLFVDDSLYFSQVAEKFSYDKTGLIVFDRDFQLMSEGKGRFIRMWKFDESLDIPFHRTETNGIISSKKERFNARLEVFDFNGNKSEINMTFLRDMREAPEIMSFSVDSANYNFVIKRDSLSHIYKAIDLNWVNKKGTFIDNATMTNFMRTDSTYSFSTKKQKNLVLKIKGISPKTDAALITFFNPNETNSENSVEITYEHKTKTFVAKLNFKSAPQYEPHLFLHNDKSFKEIKLSGISPTEFITLNNSFKNWYNAHTIEIRDGSKIISRANNELMPITPKSNKLINNDLFSLEIPPEFVFDTMMVAYRVDTNFFHAKYNLLSDVVTFSPENQILKKRGKLTINIPDEMINLEHLSIYAIDHKNARLISNEIDTIKKTMTAEIKSLGSYALLKDETPPTITNIFPNTGKYYKKSSVKTLKCIINDKLSGLAGEDFIIMKLNNEKVIAEWHPIHHTLEYRLEDKLPKGKHNLSITLHDKAGNIATKEVEFHIVD